MDCSELHSLQTPAECSAALGSLQSPWLAVHPERCVRLRHRLVECGRCADACTGGAIGLEDGMLDVDPRRCVGCGACATACPTGAFEPLNPDDATLMAALLATVPAKEGLPVVECRRRNVSGAVDVVCLGHLGHELLVEMAARGMDGVVLESGPCERCPLACGAHSCEREVRLALEILGKLGSRFEVRWSRADAFDEESGLLRACDEFPDQVEGDAPALGLHKTARGTLPQAVPSRRTRLFNSLRRLVGEGAPDTATCEDAPWGTVEVDRDRCTGCRTCTVFCPTGALRAAGQKDGEPWGLEHRGTLCMRCGACEAICPHGALTVRQGASLGAFVRGDQTFIELDRPDWTPNRPDSMFRKWSKLLGGSNMAEY